MTVKFLLETIGNAVACCEIFPVGRRRLLSSDEKLLRLSTPARHYSDLR